MQKALDTEKLALNKQMEAELVASRASEEVETSEEVEACREAIIELRRAQQTLEEANTVVADNLNDENREILQPLLEETTALSKEMASMVAVFATLTVLKAPGLQKVPFEQALVDNLREAMSFFVDGVECPEFLQAQVDAFFKVSDGIEVQTGSHT